MTYDVHDYRKNEKTMHRQEIPLFSIDKINSDTIYCNYVSTHKLHNLRALRVNCFESNCSCVEQGNRLSFLDDTPYGVFSQGALDS